MSLLLFQISASLFVLTGVMVLLYQLVDTIFGEKGFAKIVLAVLEEASEWTFLAAVVTGMCWLLSLIWSL